VHNELNVLKVAMLENLQISIEPYNYDKHHRQLSELIINTLQREFNIPVEYVDLPDLENVNKFFSNFWVACCADVPVGSIGLKIYDDFAIIKKLIVHKDFRCRNLGIAQKLLTSLELDCIKNKTGKIYLGTRGVFKAAHRFYEKNGFIEIAKEKLPKAFPVMQVDTKFYTKNIN